MSNRSSQVSSEQKLPSYSVLYLFMQLSYSHGMITQDGTMLSKLQLCWKEVFRYHLYVNSSVIQQGRTCKQMHICILYDRGLIPLIISWLERKFIIALHSTKFYPCYPPLTKGKLITLPTYKLIYLWHGKESEEQLYWSCKNIRSNTEALTFV